MAALHMCGSNLEARVCSRPLLVQRRQRRVELEIVAHGAGRLRLGAWQRSGMRVRAGFDAGAHVEAGCVPALSFTRERAAVAAENLDRRCCFAVHWRRQPLPQGHGNVADRPHPLHVPCRARRTGTVLFLDEGVCCAAGIVQSGCGVVGLRKG